MLRSLLAQAVAVGVAFGAAADVDWRIVAADQGVPRLVMFSGEPGASTNALWRWDPREDPSLTREMAASFRAIDECKSVDGGRTVLVNASCGGVAAVDVATARAKWCAFLPYPHAGPHSLDILPDGRVAVANSTGVDALQIIDLNGHPFEPSKQRVVKALSVPGAHGVVWDASRQSLFVLGYTNLYELAYLPQETAVKVLRAWDYSVVCGDAYGHDLVPDGRGGYHFTNHTGVWRIDPADGTFTKVLDVANVKSFSRDVAKGDLLSVPREKWWTDRLLVRDGAGNVRTVGPFAGARFYKARWMSAVAAEAPREWRPKERLCGFNLLGMFCKTKMAAGDKRISGYFPEDRFRWMHGWGFNFARLPLDYRFFVRDGDWMKIEEAQLKKLDAAVAYGRKYGIHVNIDFHRAPGYCINPPAEPKRLFADPEPMAAFTNLWATLARRYRGIPNDELTFDLVNEPGEVQGATLERYVRVAKAAIAAIRAEDPERFVMSDGWGVGNVPADGLHPLPHNVGESIHPYSPHTVTHFGVKAAWLPQTGVCPPWPPKGCDSGRKWFLDNYFAAWRTAEREGCYLHLGEFGTYYKCPHATALKWTEDLLSIAREKGLGWAMWNLDGAFGILDSGRDDCELEDFEGHKLDRAMLNLLLKYK